MLVSGKVVVCESGPVGGLKSFLYKAGPYASDPVAHPEVSVFAATVAADGKRSSGKPNALKIKKERCRGAYTY